jgi:methionine-rich copper-binding protein CopC
MAQTPTLKWETTMKTIAFAGLLGILATTVAAHSALNGTTPADTEIVSRVPSEVLLDFKNKIRLTRVIMTHADHKGVDLDLSGNKGFVSEYEVPMQPMGRGVYVIDWRGLGTDGHAVNGSFSFNVE